jgi:hypothetical protein
MRHLAMRLASVLILSTTLALAVSVAPAGAMNSDAARTDQRHHGHGQDRSALFVVNTEFGVEDSPVVRATGPFKSCTTVTDVFGDVYDLGNITAFYGVKSMTCAAGNVILSYGAVQNPRTFDTHGTWTILVSTLPGVRSGGGTLFGDADACDDVTGNGCILDTFRMRH